MAASVVIKRWTGAAGSPAKRDISSFPSDRASTYDDPSPGTSWPIPIPGAGSKFSYWVTHRLCADTTPSGTIDNIRWYTDGTNNYGTGVSYRVAEASFYVEAAGTPGDTGTELTTGNHAGCLTEAVNGFTYTTGSPLAVDGSVTNPDTGDFGNFVVSQIEVFPGAGAGEITDETLTWKLMSSFPGGRPSVKNLPNSAEARWGHAELIRSLERECVEIIQEALRPSI